MMRLLLLMMMNNMIVKMTRVMNNRALSQRNTNVKCQFQMMMMYAETAAGLWEFQQNCS